MRVPAGARPAAAMLCVWLLAAGACGIPDDQDATLAQPDDVPFDLLAPAPSASTSSTIPRAQSTEVDIFLVQGDRLAIAEREVPAPASPEMVLEALANGPTEREISLGLRSALIGEGVVRSVGVTGGIATVDLGSAFTDIALRDQIVALAQIVSTLTGLPGIGRVSFTLAGVPVGVPRGDGSVTTESVSRDDYALLAPVPTG